MSTDGRPNKADARIETGKIRVKEWIGYIPNSDPHDLPPGASPDTLNVTSVRPGELTVRLGVSEVKFD